MPRTHRTRAVIATALATALGTGLATEGVAAELYSIDILTNTLVTLDTATGEVTTVGNAGVPGLVTLDLAYAQGSLRALSQFGSVHQLHTIDTDGGGLISSVTVTLDGAAIGRATGLAVRGDDLIIGFTPDVESARASHLGLLGLDGAITDVVDFSAFDADFHGLAVAPDDVTLFSVDSGFTNDVYSTTVEPQTYAFIGGGSFAAVNDVVFLANDLWGLSSVAQDSSSLVRIDARTGATLEDVPIDVFPGQSLFTGLAHVPCTGDVDGDDAVTFADLVSVLAAWGPCVGCEEDVDGDGAVGLTDVVAVLAAWGPCS